MENRKLVVLLVGLVAFGLTSVCAQSKKEQIKMLTHQTDSLGRVLLLKNESIILLQVKLAREQGAATAHNEQIYRLEMKTDSLRELLISRNVNMESQASKMTQLNIQITDLQAQLKDLTGKNEALATELNSLKQKPTDAGTTPKDTKPADAAKQDVKTGSTATSNPPNP